MSGRQVPNVGHAPQTPPPSGGERSGPGEQGGRRPHPHEVWQLVWTEVRIWLTRRSSERLRSRSEFQWPTEVSLQVVSQCEGGGGGGRCLCHAQWWREPPRRCGSRCTSGHGQSWSGFVPACCEWVWSEFPRLSHDQLHPCECVTQRMRRGFPVLLTCFGAGLPEHHCYGYLDSAVPSSGELPQAVVGPSRL